MIKLLPLIIDGCIKHCRDADDHLIAADIAGSGADDDIWWHHIVINNDKSWWVIRTVWLDKFSETCQGMSHRIVNPSHIYCICSDIVMKISNNNNHNCQLCVSSPAPGETVSLQVGVWCICCWLELFNCLLITGRGRVSVVMVEQCAQVLTLRQVLREHDLSHDHHSSVSVILSAW